MRTGSKPERPVLLRCGDAARTTLLTRATHWLGYTNKACRPRLKPYFFIVRAGGESSAAGGFPSAGDWRTRRDLVHIAAPFQGVGGLKTSPRDWVRDTGVYSFQSFPRSAFTALNNMLLLRNFIYYIDRSNGYYCNFFPLSKST